MIGPSFLVATCRSNLPLVSTAQLCLPAVCDPDQVALPGSIDARNRRGRQEMVGPQSQRLKYSFPLKPYRLLMWRRRVFSPIAAIEANHIRVAHGLANRDSRGECFFGKGC